jgi:glutaminyl-tRNA synthetase
MSKRKLLELVREGHVSGWDDPRMPTISGMRRRGFTAAALRRFCDRIGVARRDNIVDISLLEHALREDLNATSPRAMAVLRPLRVVIDNWPEGEVEHFEIMNHPEHPEQGTRRVPFGRELWVERDDFAETAHKKWHRLAPGAEVRLRGAALITCREVVKDAAGEVVELRCTWDPASKGGTPADGRRVKGTLHWVSAEHAVDAEVRLYDRLFTVEDPSGDRDVDFTQHLNPASLEVIAGAKLEPSLAACEPGARLQFERLGYFCADLDSTPSRPVWNRTITLRDTWAKIAAKG